MPVEARDRYFNTETISSPPARVKLVTPSDTDNLRDVPKCLLVGHDGSAGPARSNVACKDVDGNAFTLSVVPGQQIWVRPVQILATGTTAGVVLYAGY